LSWTREKINDHCKNVELFIQVDPTDIPSNKQRKNKNWVVADWVQSKWNLGFDSVQHNRSGIDATILWEPFAAIATHKFYFDAAALRILAGRVQRPRVVFQQELIQFKMPGMSHVFQWRCKVYLDYQLFEKARPTFSR